MIWRKKKRAGAQAGAPPERKETMFAMQTATVADVDAWRTFDALISQNELLTKLRNRRCYLLTEDSVPVGVLRYNLFWDEIPFVTLLFLMEGARGKGYGKRAMQMWEMEMRYLGFPCVMTSTQADETAQHFYRKLGYKDAGCLILNEEPRKQPAEIFFIKTL